jgi:hypothetical protein
MKKIPHKILHQTEQCIKGIIQYDQQKLISGVQNCFKYQCHLSYEQAKKNNMIILIMQKKNLTKFNTYS